MRRPTEKASARNAQILRMIGNMDDNPRIAEVLGIACAYEVYQQVNSLTGYPTRDSGYVVVLRADGPWVLYVDSWKADSHQAAVRMACEKACKDVADEEDAKLPPPAPLAGIEYAASEDDDLAHLR